MVYIPPASNALDFELNAYVVPAADALDFTLDYEQGEGAVLEDMQLDINLIQDTLEDAKLDLSVYYESYDIVFPLDVLTWAEIAEDNKFDLFSAYESFDILPLNLQFSSEVTRDTILDIYLSNGYIFESAPLDIEITDGIKLIDMGLDVLTLPTMPNFKTIYGMNIHSVIKEVV